MRSRPNRGSSLRFGNLILRHPYSSLVHIEGDACQCEPFVCFNVILRNTATIQVKEPETVSTLSRPTVIGHMLCSFPVPGGGGGEVLWNEFSFFIGLPNAELCVGITLVSRPEVPSQSFFLILLHDPSLFVHHAEPELSIDGSVVGRLSQPVQSGLGIVPNTTSRSICLTQPVLGFRVPLLCGFSEPVHGFLQLLVPLNAEGVMDSKCVLRLRVTCVGFLSQGMNVERLLPARHNWRVIFLSEKEGQRKQ